jgi:hypothetical protein
MLTNVSEVHTASIIRAMSEPHAKEQQVIFETLINIYLTTQQYIPEDS